ncbi:MAG: ferric reductase-like transmembrane domain-containing protein [Pseudotabrizicola sp.]|uniref:ferredoxin reductase family protein n=1 Tax=Pseudotabrizicola sp. TaxID=2939647 RepID=UPI00271A7D98|nr:ferric reductase-like transmembrane domain-containing protein [Pseudotabrizicola sp.]MDO9638408.1 ferric reductase-like transmembrane domain-containing protein [Pseudotabrizicola sp.]
MSKAPQLHQKPEKFIRTADHPAVVLLHAGFWLTAGFAVIALPFFVLLTGDFRPPPIGVLWDFSMGCGFAALSLTAIQFALTGRIRVLTSPFGADIVYVFHRFLSWGAVALMFAHFGVLYFWYEPALGVLNPLKARWELTLGRLALLCFAALIVTSELRKRVKLDYHWWRVIHVSLAVIGFAAAVAHVLGVGKYSAMEDTRSLWIGVTVVWVGFILWSRLVRPLVQTFNPWRVVSNEDEGGGVHTLTLRPEGRPLTAWRPGQFAWLSIGHSPWSMKEHPFTISTAPDRGPQISVSIKALGDDSGRLIKTQPGAVAYVDGPFGTFSIDREAAAEGFVMVAGGVGITPVIANLHALQSRKDPRPVILIYANATLDVVAFRDELDRIAQDIDLTIVHVLEEVPDGWTGETGRIDEAVLERHLPDRSRSWPHMLCGPAPMTGAVIKALRKMGVSARQIDLEVFDMV